MKTFMMFAFMFIVTVCVTAQSRAEGFGSATTTTNLSGTEAQRDSGFAASTTTTDLDDRRQVYQQVENCWPRSIFGFIFGQSCPDPGEQALKHAIAARIRSEGSVNSSRADINTAISQNVAARFETKEMRPDGSIIRTESLYPEGIRALADLAAANASDRNKVSAYSGGGGNGYSRSRASANVDLYTYYRNGGF